MATVIIRGSWGDLKVDRATGTILSYDHDGVELTDDEPGYSDILFVLPETLAPGLDACLDKHGETDILCVGYVTARGLVIDAMQRIEDEDGFMVHDDLLRLPAPWPAGWACTS